MATPSSYELKIELNTLQSEIKEKKRLLEEARKGLRGFTPGSDLYKNAVKDYKIDDKEGELSKLGEQLERQQQRLAAQKASEDQQRKMAQKSKDVYVPKPATGLPRWQKQNMVELNFSKGRKLDIQDLKTRLDGLDHLNFKYRHVGKGIYKVNLPEGGDVYYNRKKNMALLTQHNEKSYHHAAMLFKELGADSVNLQHLPRHTRSAAKDAFEKPDINLAVKGLAKTGKELGEDLRKYRPHV